MSDATNTDPTTPPRFTMPGAPDPVAAGVMDDPGTPDPADTPTSVEGDGGGGPLDSIPTGESTPAEPTLEDAIAKALGLDSPDTGIPAPVDGEPASGEGSSILPDAGSSTTTPDGSAPVEPVAGEPAPETPPAHPSDNLIELAEGVVVDRETILNLHEWAQSLTPEEQRRVEWVLANPSAPSPYPSAASGSGTPAPYGPPAGAGVAPYPPVGYPAAGQPGMPVAPGMAPGIPAQPAPLDPSTITEKLGELAEVIPGLPEILAQQQQAILDQQAQIARFQQAQAQQADAQLNAERERIAQGVRAGEAAFIEAHPQLAPTDLHYITQQAAQSGLMAAQMPRFDGDASAAYKATLETIMWSDEKYRSMLVQQQATEIANRHAETQSRRDAASSLSGSSGSVARDPQSAPAGQPQMTMTDYLRAVMADGL